MSLILRQAESLQGWLINRGSDREAIVSLERCDSCARLRSHASINRSRVVTIYSQLLLHFDDYSARRQGGVAGVDWSIIRVPVGCDIAPTWIPVAVPPSPPPTPDEHDGGKVASPPRAVMPCPLVVVKRGVPCAVETRVPPVVGDADISGPITQHVVRKREVSLPIHG